MLAFAKGEKQRTVVGYVPEVKNQFYHEFEFFCQNESSVLTCIGNGTFFVICDIFLVLIKNISCQPQWKAKQNKSDNYLKTFEKSFLAHIVPWSSEK